MYTNQGPLSHMFIVSSRDSSGRLGGGGGGGRKVLWHFMYSFNCPSSYSHNIVGLNTGGLELVWISGVISMVEGIAHCVSLCNYCLRKLAQKRILLNSFHYQYFPIEYDVV